MLIILICITFAVCLGLVYFFCYSVHIQNRLCDNKLREYGVLAFKSPEERHSRRSQDGVPLMVMLDQTGLLTRDENLRACVRKVVTRRRYTALHCAAVRDVDLMVVQSMVTVAPNEIK